MIYLLCSTIRPEVFKTTHRCWMQNCGNPDNIKTKIVVDKQDDAITLVGFDVMVYGENNTGITKPLTRLTRSLSGLNDTDIIVVMSDDFFPPKNWDSFLIEQFNGFDGALRVSDGNPLTAVHNSSIITIPIMTYSCLKRLNGIVYHPAYTHFYSDNELNNNLMQMAVLKNACFSDYVFEHRHWSIGKRNRDNCDERVSGQMDADDRNTYHHRCGMSLEDRLRL